MKITVTCYSGYRVDESPTSIRLGSRVVTVREVADRWLAPDHRYFKCLGDDGGFYIIRQDMHALNWELVYFEQREANGGVSK
jgi:hypothetical protein